MSDRYVRVKAGGGYRGVAPFPYARGRRLRVLSTHLQDDLSVAARVQLVYQPELTDAFDVRNLEPWVGGEYLVGERWVAVRGRRARIVGPSVTGIDDRRGEVTTVIDSTSHDGQMIQVDVRLGSRADTYPPTSLELVEETDAPRAVVTFTLDDNFDPSMLLAEQPEQPAPLPFDQFVVRLDAMGNRITAADALSLWRLSHVGR